jgi:hypothetical protein
MKSLLAILFPLVAFSQIPERLQEKAKMIHTNCNEQTKVIANELLVELETIQQDNMFDTTLQEYYNLLEDSQCSLYCDYLTLLWVKDKVISKSYFFKKMYTEGFYTTFLEGYKVKKDFRFVGDNDSFDQGINPDLQSLMLDYVYKKSKNDFDEVVKINVLQLSGHDLVSFLETVETNYGLEMVTAVLIDKAKASNSHSDLSFLIKMLMDKKIANSVIEDIFNTTREVWEKGNWSQKFWNFIYDNKFNVAPSPIYTKEQIDETVDNFIKNDELGINPMLNINGDAFSEYIPGKLKEALYKLHILEITILTKENCSNIYGILGKEGMIIITTR